MSYTQTKYISKSEHEIKIFADVQKLNKFIPIEESTKATVKSWLDPSILSQGYKRIHHQQTCTTRNVKGSPLGRRIIILDGDLDLHNEMKSTRMRTIQSSVSNLPVTISSGKMFHEDH